MSAANARRTRAALVNFLGSDTPNITEEKLQNPRALIVLGVEPIRIDILTSIDGLSSFSLAWKRRVKGRYGNVAANYISMVDLITAKKASGRPQDLADVDLLERFARRTSR